MNPAVRWLERDYDEPAAFQRPASDIIALAEFDADHYYGCACTVGGALVSKSLARWPEPEPGTELESL